MKRLLLLAASLAGCTTDTTDPVPVLAFTSGVTTDGPAHHVVTGERIVPGAAITVDASWIGTCDAGSDPVSDRPNPCTPPAATFRLAVTCAGGGCATSAPQTVTGHGTAAIEHLSPGALAIDGSMTDLDTDQVVATHLDLAVVPPDDLIATCHGGGGRITAGAVASGVRYASTELRVNGRPTGADGVIDLVALYPAANDGHGDLVPGAYPIALQLGDAIIRRIVDITLEPSQATTCSVRAPI